MRYQIIWRNREREPQTQDTDPWHRTNTALFESIEEAQMFLNRVLNDRLRIDYSWAYHYRIVSWEEAERLINPVCVSDNKIESSQ